MKLKKLSKSLFILMCALTMQACQSYTKQYLPPLPSNLSNDCLDLTLPADGTGGVILGWAIDTTYSYKTCAYKHKEVVNLYNEMREVINAGH